MEPFQSGPTTSSYILEDASGAIIQPDLEIYREHINAIFGTQIASLNIRIINLNKRIKLFNDEIHGYRNTDCFPGSRVCTDRCLVPGTTTLGPHSAKGARCRFNTTWYRILKSLLIN